MKKSLLKKKLKVLQNAVDIAPKDRKTFFKTCKEEDLHIICEACFNVLNNAPKLNGKALSKLKRKLKPIKSHIRGLSSIKRSLLNKRKILANKQIGRGILSVIASAVIPALITALSQ